MPRYLIALCYTLLLLANACNEPTDIGADLLDEESNINTIFIDTLSLEIWHQFPDSILLDPLTGRMQLGEIQQDPVFGRYSASFAAEFNLSAPYLVGDNPLHFDSLILTFVYANDTTPYGPKGAINNLAVYEVTEKISGRTLIDTDTQIATDINPLGRLSNYEYHPEIIRYAANDTLFSVKLAPLMQIDLSYSSLSQRLFQTLQNGTVNEELLNSDFREVFKGLYICPEAGKPNNAITTLNLLSATSNLILYFREETGLDTLEARKIIFNVGSAANLYRHYYDESTNEDFLSVIAEPSAPALSKLYAQGMDGIDMVVHLPHLESLPDAIINKAELVFTHICSDAEADSLYVLPTQFSVRTLHRYTGAIGTNSDFPMSTLITTREDVEEEGVCKARYYVPINYFVQNYLSDRNDSLDLLISVHPYQFMPDRVTLEGKNAVNEADRPKVRLFYVPLGQ